MTATTTRPAPANRRGTQLLRQRGATTSGHRARVAIDGRFEVLGELIAHPAAVVTTEASIWLIDDTS